MSRQNYLKTLIIVHQSRLQELKKTPLTESHRQKLRERPITKLSIDPEELLEVSLIEAEIEKLQTELKEIYADKSSGPSPHTPKKHDVPLKHTKWTTENFSVELIQTFSQVVLLMSAKNKQFMTSGLLLLAFLENQEAAAHQLLRDFSQKKGFKWGRFERYVEEIASEQIRDSQINFLIIDEKHIPLSNELSAALNKGATITKGQGETQCNTAYMLAAIANTNIDTSQARPMMMSRRNQPINKMAQLLNKLGITQQVVLKVMRDPLAFDKIVPSSIPKEEPVIAQSGRFWHRSAKKQASTEALGRVIVDRIITPLALNEKAKNRIKAEMLWLFAAADHFLKVRRDMVYPTSPVPVEIPQNAERIPETDNTILNMRLLFSFENEHLEQQIDGIVERVTIHLRYLNILLKQQAQPGKFEAQNAPLIYQLQGHQQDIAALSYELSQLMQQIYGVRLHGPSELDDFLEQVTI
ncbi:MAG: hypothetical protein B6243_02955 [Anaerolineaceae bacterium 4572_5.2]|nr:MAG: hypothetical protein B6243_02955 [Anaerolineaceae bacterium 4572_5.2]